MEEQQEQQLSWESIKSAATVFAAEESLNLIGHALIGNYSGMAEMAIFGGIAALAAGYNAPKVLRQLQAAIPSSEKLEPFRLLTHAEPGKRSFVDRLFDRHPSDIEEALDDGDDIQEAYILDLGITFRPHPNDVFSNRIAILGMPGAGKSNTVAVLAEELGQYDAPFIIFDQKPEYTKLCAAPYFTNPFRANAENVGQVGAYDFGQKMMNERLQVVLDLTSYDDDDKAAYVMIEIIRGVLAWEKQYDVDNRLPVTFFFEEADYWLPQSEQHAHVDRSKEKGGKSLFNKLQQTVFNLVHRGRSFGMGTVISTQRPANIDNRAFAVAEWKILLKANMPNDLKVYEGWGLDSNAAQILGKGEAYIIGPDIKGLYQIRKRHSPDEASTPGLKNLQRKRVVREQIAQQPLPSTSTTGGDSTSRSTSMSTSNSPPAEVAGNGATGSGKWTEVGGPLPQLSELEKQIGDLFFLERMKKSKIIEQLYPPNAKSGNANIKASEEIDEAIRKYAEVARHRAIRMMREERGL